MAVKAIASAALTRFRPVGRGSRVGLVAPASPFSRADFDAGVAELARLGFEPIFDERVFDRETIVAGPAMARAGALADLFTRPDIDAVLAVRGGYGSSEMLPFLDVSSMRSSRTALIGYSDVTSLHTFLTCHAGLMTVHGPMIDGRLAVGETAYDRLSFLGSLSAAPLGELAPPSLEVLRAGEAAGPLFGGTLTQLAASMGTPYAFAPPAGHVLLIDEVGERPYRIRRMLTQLAQCGVLAMTSAVVVGQLPGCDEPGGRLSGVSVFAEFFRDFPGPVLAGFPTGHSIAPLISVPLGAVARVVGLGAPALVLNEAAAAA